MNISPKSHESSFPTICFPNGNVVKFSHTNRKHFTVGNLMAYLIVKMENKNSQNLPFPLDDVDHPSNTAMPWPTARTTPNRSFDG